MEDVIDSGARVALLVSDDKLGRRLVESIRGGTRPVLVIKDQSSSYKRILKLVRRGILSWQMILKMGWSELRRRDTVIDSEDFLHIENNRELLDHLQAHEIECLVLFRAGLIINRAVLSSGVRLLNVHCADIPTYGGLGSIYRALRDEAFEQNATMHVVTKKIDEGEVVALRPYRMSSDLSYSENEDRAYMAGIDLIQAVLGGGSASSNPRNDAA